MEFRTAKKEVELIGGVHKLCKLSVKRYFLVQPNPGEFYLEFLSGCIQQELVPWKRAFRKMENLCCVSIFPGYTWQFRPI